MSTAGAARRLAAGASAFLAAALLIGGCGGSEEPEPAPAPEPPRETIDHVPKLPDGWRVHVNREAGFAFGLPRGWKADDSRRSTLVRSFDRLVAISITADRSDGALGLAPRAFALRASRSLRGYERLEAGRAHRFRHRYDAALVRAKARAKRTGVNQRVELLVLRRPELAVFTAVVAANAERDSSASVRLAGKVIETLRGRPVVERKRQGARKRQGSRSGRSG